MPDQTEKRPSNASTTVTAAILAGAAIVAIIGTFLPGWVGLTGGPAVALRLVFYVVAAIDVAIALWLRAKFRKNRSSRNGGAVQRQ
jgi:hypothetical protein